MFAFIVTALVGVLCIYLGTRHMKGDISSLHSYHRNRVSEEDIPAFGKVVGIGTILVGVGVILMSVCSIVSVYTQQDVWTSVGMVVMAVFLVVGIGISFYAMIKYNKGIF